MSTSDYVSCAGAAGHFGSSCNRNIAASAKTRGPSNSRTFAGAVRERRWSAARRCKSTHRLVRWLSAHFSWPLDTSNSLETQKDDTVTASRKARSEGTRVFVEVVRKLGRDGASRRSLRAPYDYHVSNVSRIMRVRSECSGNG